jgi:hypothetical protein
MKGNNKSLLERKETFDRSVSGSVRTNLNGNITPTPIKSCRKQIFSDYINPDQNQNRGSHRSVNLMYQNSPTRLPQTKMDIALARAERAREISRKKNFRNSSGYSDSDFGDISYNGSSRLGMSLNINTNINILNMTENQQMNESRYTMSRQSINKSSSVTKILETKSSAIPESLLS